jgi:hypothetical protein
MSLLASDQSFDGTGDNLSLSSNKTIFPFLASSGSDSSISLRSNMSPLALPSDGTFSPINIQKQKTWLFIDGSNMQKYIKAHEENPDLLRVLIENDHDTPEDQKTVLFRVQMCSYTIAEKQGVSFVSRLIQRDLNEEGIFNGYKTFQSDALELIGQDLYKKFLLMISRHNGPEEVYLQIERIRDIPPDAIPLIIDRLILINIYPGFFREY